MSKLAIYGCTGMVGAEVVHEALIDPSIASIVAIARKEVKPVDNVDSSAAKKLQSIILKDFLQYPEEVKSSLADIDGCIYSIGTVPKKLADHSWEDLVKFNRDYCLEALKQMVEARTKSTPLKFIYVSGIGIRRPDEGPGIVPKEHPMYDYSIMRGKLEAEILGYAAQHPGKVDVGVIRLGVVDKRGAEAERNGVRWEAPPQMAGFGFPYPIEAQDLAKAMIHEAVNGLSNDTYWQHDLFDIRDKVNGVKGAR